MKLRWAIAIIILILPAAIPVFGQNTNVRSKEIVDTQTAVDPAVGYYIANWKKSVRTLTQDSADFIGLPYPYSTPTLAGNQMFREMYYWDSYFINKGLIAYHNYALSTPAARPQNRN